MEIGRYGSPGQLAQSRAEPEIKSDSGYAKIHLHLAVGRNAKEMLLKLRFAKSQNVKVNELVIRHYDVIQSTSISVLSKSGLVVS